MGFNSQSFEYENDTKGNDRNNNDGCCRREIMAPVNTNKTSIVTNMTFSHIDNTRSYKQIDTKKRYP